MQATPNVTANSASFLALNRESFDQLVTFVDFAAEKLTLAFVSVNFEADRETLLQALEADPRCQDIQFERLHFADPTLRFLREALLEMLQQRSVEFGKKRVLVITGLEQSIGMVGEYPPILQDLNYVRDAFSTAAPYPMLVCLPDGALTRLAKFAPDFWAWRMATFRFQTAATTAEAARQQTLESEQILGGLDKAKRRERLDLLLRLLADHEQAKESKTQIEILTALGELYRELGDVRQADEVLRRAVALASRNLDYGLQKAEASCHLGWLRQVQGQVDEAVQLYETAIQLFDQLEDWKGKAAALHNLANIYATQGQVNEAIALYQQSLALYEQIGNVQGKAAPLHGMANIYADQGKTDEAIALHQESLALEEQIGNVGGKASSLHGMANIYANQGKTDEAITLYQQSLALYEQIGDVQGKAAALHGMAGIYADQGKVNEAIALHQQSLALEEQIGNVQGKAAALHGMAGIYVNQGKVNEAIALHQQSLALEEQIGNVQGKAAALHGMAGIYADQGKVNEAIALYQESLALEEQIGDVQGKAMTLWWLGHIAQQQGDFETAIVHLQESLQILQHIGSPDAATVEGILADMMQMRQNGS